MNKKTKSYLNIVLILLIILLLTMLKDPLSGVYSLVSSILYPFFISFGLAFVMHPFAAFLSNKLKLRMLFSNLIIVGFILVALVLFITIEVPSLSVQIIEIGTNLIASVEDIINYINSDALNQMLASIDVASIITSVQNYLINFLGTVSANITSIALIPVLFIYFLFGYDKIKNSVKVTLKKYHMYSQYAFIRNLEKDVSKYISGLMITVLILAVLCAVGFSVIKLPNGVFLGVLIGISGVIPYFGALISGSIAVVLALGVSFELALFTLIIILLAQLLESNIITPNLQGKNLKLHPVMILLGLSTFSVLLGFVGMLLAIPLLLASRIAFNMFFRDKLIQFRENSTEVMDKKEAYNIED